MTNNDQPARPPAPLFVVCPLSVKLEKTWGQDHEPALAAWTSTRLDFDERQRGRWRGFTARLVNDGHLNPLEHCGASFLLEVDDATHVQLVRKRVGISFNVQSRRYSEDRTDRYYIPADLPQPAQERLRAHLERSAELYHNLAAELGEAGVPRSRAKETARYAQPKAAMVRIYTSANLKALLDLAIARDHGSAQAEIREVVQRMLALVEPAFPHAVRLIRNEVLVQHAIREARKGLDLSADLTGLRVVFEVGP